MKLSDLPDDFTTDQFRDLDKPSLDAVPYTVLKWFCQAKGCQNGTTVRDYGLDGFYFLNRNSKRSELNPRDYWMGQNNYWLCGKHNKLFKRLEKRFDFEHIMRRLLDPNRKQLITILSKTSHFVEKL